MANQLFTEAIESATHAGKSLDEIDAEIIEPAALSPAQKGALLFFAFSLRQRGEQRRYARESLRMTGILPAEAQDGVPRTGRRSVRRRSRGSQTSPGICKLAAFGGEITQNG